MSILFQPTAHGGAYRDRFGLDCSPTRSGPVAPGMQALFVRRPRGARGSSIRERFEVASGRFGLIPLFSPTRDHPDTAFARAESAQRERNFLQPWKRGHRCVLLADWLERPEPATGGRVRVRRRDGQPLALAGLWNGWRSPQGECVDSFALFTLPARDDAQQRWTVFLRDAWLDDWLQCPVEETAAYLRLFAGEDLMHEPAPAQAPVSA